MDKTSLHISYRSQNTNKIHAYNITCLKIEPPTKEFGEEKSFYTTSPSLTFLEKLPKTYLAVQFPRKCNSLHRGRYVSEPKFSAPITNVTAPVGREAILACIVQDLSAYKVAWLRVDTQTILTIHNHVITKNRRIGVSHSDHRTWYLHIREVRPADRGWYMCQINTDPMKSQLGYLDVVVPPDILDYPTSADMSVREGSNVTLRCAAVGAPQPQITWRREGGELIKLSSGEEVASVEGPILNISRVNRLHMGAYLCIASNGVPPTVSKRIMLIIHFPPMMWIPNQLVGAVEGLPLTLECLSEAYPKSINYWTREKGEIVPQGGKYESVVIENSYKIHMKLMIKAIDPSDYGSYKCVSKNSLGDTDGTVKVYHKNRKTSNAVDSNDIADNIVGSQDLKMRTRQEIDDQDYENSQENHTSNLSVVIIATTLLFLRNWI
ncbi:opioid-binding protein/cell adhesion molecule homolog [Arctopsyche grandis]|uniref:opioid-binding protein/cell adhesion molecule homolog n=1 Tax=Arctopsyche grandis TaxID=121162 RepID=UPI00406D9282